MTALLVLAASVLEPDDTAQPAANAAAERELHERIRAAGGNEHMRYRLYGSEADAPEDGYKILLVLPGGDGSDDFRGFARNIHAHALPNGYVIAQLIAPVWDAQQAEQIVWPSEQLRWPTMEFSTEQFVAAVIDDVAERLQLNPQHMYALGWSSSGPAIYATALQQRTKLTGVFIAMSVFQPQNCPPIENGAGRTFYILHSPDDFIPMRFPQSARDALRHAGATVHLETYEGGHGWHGDVFGNIRRGVLWLEQHNVPPAEDAEEGEG